MAASAPQLVLGGAEALVRVGPVTVTPTGGQLTVESGPWLRDPVTGCSRGALGVPLDDVTGFLVAAAAPPGRWPVSLGIRLDLLADPPLDGSPLTARGELAGLDERGGTTRGTVTDARGGLLALVVQRSHLVAVDEAPSGATPAPPPPGAGVSLRAALGVRAADPGVLELPPSVYTANGMGNLHGGILICSAEFAAAGALGATGEFRTTSVDITYVRPADARGATTFRPRVLHRGRSLAVVRVTALNSANKPCAIATVVLQERVR
ncbi:PaaI family thioesterase [Nocardia harenae]|uniref:PaaI family thioesterase n=1 Tax=Nocardia harenae TaxID=358707 RepID=UPI00083475E0|nr:acyl-CoA thioesterase domain-containing protein [Nocardia harenae]